MEFRVDLDILSPFTETRPLREERCVCKEWLRLSLRPLLSSQSPGGQEGEERRGRRGRGVKQGKSEDAKGGVDEGAG